MSRVNWLTIFCLVFTCTDGARILGVFPMPWGSHYILGEKLVKGIAEAGHNVTYITPHPTKNVPENVSLYDVVLEGFPEQFNAMIAKDDKVSGRPGSLYSTLKQYGEWNEQICNITLNHPNLKKLIESGETFDVVVVTQGFGNDCLLVLSHIFKGHLILASTVGPYTLSSKKVGNPLSIATVPFLFNTDPGLSPGFGLIPRLKNFIYNIEGSLFNEWLILSHQDEVLKRTFPGIPSLSDLQYNVSLLLLNSHPSYTNAEPLVPNAVEIGGFHVDPPKKLPEDLQTFLDNATEGAIFFSLGSTVKSKNLPEWKRQIFLDVFKSLPVKVLWKFEADLPGKPDNVLIKSWLPQQDILAHPNVKLFITHGGLLSSIETVYHGVPVLCLPLFGDQDLNSNKAVQAGYALKLDLHDDNFNAKLLSDTLNELLYNPKYSEMAKHRSRVFHDRPLTAMQNAVYWIEYVIRHNGAPHLKVAAVGMPWYKYYMVDVVAVLAGGILLGIFILAFSVKLILSRFLCSQSKNKIKKC